MVATANQEVFEGTVSSSAVTLTLKRPATTIEIINDSGVRDLQYKFKESQDYATLHKCEAFSCDGFHTSTIILDSPDDKSVSYRVRVLN